MKNRKRIDRAVPLLVAVGVVLAAGCHEGGDVLFSSSLPGDALEGNGNVVEELRPIAGCTRVELRGVGVLYVRQGAQEELRIRAEENLLPHLRTDVQAGELVIWKDVVTLMNTRPIEYHLTVTDLERASLFGAGEIRASDLDTGPLALSLSGVGQVELVGLRAARLTVDVSGVGDVIVSGSAQQQTISLRSLGSYDGRNLDSDEADVSLADMGSATVWVRDRLHATIRGSGSVYYAGNPVVTSSITGSGNVVPIGG